MKRSIPTLGKWPLKVCSMLAWFLQCFTPWFSISFSKVGTPSSCNPCAGVSMAALVTSSFKTGTTSAPVHVSSTHMTHRSWQSFWKPIWVINSIGSRGIGWPYYLTSQMWHAFSRRAVKQTSFPEVFTATWLESGPCQDLRLKCSLSLSRASIPLGISLVCVSCEFWLWQNMSLVVFWIYSCQLHIHSRKTTPSLCSYFHTPTALQNISRVKCVRLIQSKHAARPFLASWGGYPQTSRITTIAMLPNYINLTLSCLLLVAGHPYTS